MDNEKVLRLYNRQSKQELAYASAIFLVVIYHMAQLDDLGLINVPFRTTKKGNKVAEELIRLGWELTNNEITLFFLLNEKDMDELYETEGAVEGITEWLLKLNRNGFESFQNEVIDTLAKMKKDDA